MKLGHGVSLSTEMRPSPELVRVAQVLTLSTVELAEMIDNELAENPALEVEPGDDLVEWRLPVAAEYDPVAACAYRPTPLEELWHEVAPNVTTEDHAVARYVLGSLDARGLLSETPAEIAEDLGVPVARVETVLALIQEVAPPGVGAKDPAEAVLLQVRDAVAEGSTPPLVPALVDRHLSALCDGDVERIAQSEGVTPAEVSNAIDFLRRRVRPFPSLESVLPSWGTAAVDAALPSVWFRRTASGEIAVEVLEARRHPLTLSSSYEVTVAAGPDASPADRRTRSHVELHRRRATEFLAQMRQRWRTLQSISECVARRQGQYLLRGPRFLERLTRADVAEEIGVHESTVSRATANKYVLMPDDSLAPFHCFFSTSAPVLEALKELLREEDRPRSDGELARVLAARGHHVARRTVAKYRSVLGIPPSHRRAPSSARV